MANLKRFGNVLEYGFSGNGTDADTALLQQCINENSIVEFPSGTYTIKSVNVPARTTIRGQGDATIIRATTSTTGNLFNITGGFAVIESMRIDGQGVSGSLNAIGDFDTSRTSDNTFELVKVTDVNVYNMTGSAVYFAGRGMDYVITRLSCWNVAEYGIYLGENNIGVSDSQITGCLISGTGKQGIYFANGNTRITATKVCLSGRKGYPAIHLNDAIYVSMATVELQQNCYDALHIQNGGGHNITSLIIDSNNMNGLTGDYCGVRLSDGTQFNKISGTLIDGRFKNVAAPYGMTSLYGVVVSDNNSGYNDIDMKYYPYQYKTIADRIIPYSVPINDISSTFKLNGRDYYNFNNQAIVVGINAKIDAAKTDTIGLTATATAQGIDFKVNTAKSITTSMMTYQRLTLDTTALWLAGKTKLYITFQVKVMNGVAVDLNLSEESTTHTTNSSNGTHLIMGTARNIQYLDGATYKTMRYCSEAGYKAHIDFDIWLDKTISVNANDVLVSVKNIRISAV
ncbi:hypothetical protein IEC97_11305 [Neobacillus cucumis]|uniref:hypothetical protein n=1 Tax=Neobacillus cucumis TaxID=1740721 RepID=UPI0018DF6400|nr:hypothetical protein [Neobacillus cucumis]MBI0577945.1 hypothetical protein [Neobacillus cucumis]